MIHNGNANAMAIPPNNVFAANPAGTEGAMEVTDINPPPPIQTIDQEPNLAANQCQESEQAQADLVNIQSSQHRSKSNLMCNRSSGPQVCGLNTCMTDSLNQHPPAMPTALSSPGHTACPTGVRENSTHDKTTSLSHPEALTTTVIPEKAPPHLNKSSRKELKSTQPRKHKKGKAPLTSDQHDQFWSMTLNQAMAIEQSLLKDHKNTSKGGNDDSSRSEPHPSPRRCAMKEQMRTNSSNFFAALQDDQDDEDDLSVTIASCD